MQRRADLACFQRALASRAQTALHREVSRSPGREPLWERKFLIRSRGESNPRTQVRHVSGPWALRLVDGSTGPAWWRGRDPEFALSDPYSCRTVGGTTLPKTSAPGVEHRGHSVPAYLLQTGTHKPLTFCPPPSPHVKAKCFRLTSGF